MATRASPVPTARLGRDPASVRRLQPQRREAPMPGPGTILEGLRSIANDGIVVAGVWHLCLAAACVALLFGWRPSQRAAATGMAAPVASVAVAAFRYDNPFNGIVFAALAAGMLGLAARLERRPVTVRGTASTIVGAVMIAFGWLYPHFLEQR